jgi:glycosyltransferase involved in cell wall biosynthesis
MRVSITNACSLISTGYGYVTSKIMRNMHDTGHQLLVDRPAELEFNFNHPNYFKFSDSETSVKAGYVAWESTEIPETWKKPLELIDELWVPNQFTKDVMKNYTDKEIYIFPHGVDDTFYAKEKERTDKVRFLSIGHPAKRKNVPEVIKSFLELYAGNMDYELTIKMYAGADNLEINEPNIKVIDRNLLYDQMASLMHDHDVLLYPSYGEGFGLIPLQAMATGTPAIINGGWADYTEFSHGLVISSTLEESPWQNYHPGKMYTPDHDDFIKLIQHTVSNLDAIQQKQLMTSDELHSKYAWKKVIKDHFDSVESRLMV